LIGQNEFARKGLRTPTVNMQRKPWQYVLIRSRI